MSSSSSSLSLLPGEGVTVVYCIASQRSRKGKVCDRSYIGYTTNLTRRLRQHNGELVGGAKATRGYAKWQCMWYVQGFNVRNNAMQLEWRLHHAAAAPRKSPPSALGSVSRRCYQLYKAVTMKRFTRNSPLNTFQPLQCHVIDIAAWYHSMANMYVWPRHWFRIRYLLLLGSPPSKNSIPQLQDGCVSLDKHIKAFITMTMAMSSIEDVIVNLRILSHVPPGGKIKTNTGRFIEIDNDIGQWLWRGLHSEHKKGACYYIETLVNRAIDLNRNSPLDLQNKIDITQAMETGRLGIVTLKETTYNGYPTQCETLQRRVQLLDHEIARNYAYLKSKNGGVTPNKLTLKNSTTTTPQSPTSSPSPTPPSTTQPQLNNSMTNNNNNNNNGNVKNNNNGGQAPTSSPSPTPPSTQPQLNNSMTNNNNNGNVKNNNGGGGGGGQAKQNNNKKNNRKGRG